MPKTKLAKSKYNHAKFAYRAVLLLITFTFTCEILSRLYFAADGYNKIDETSDTVDNQQLFPKPIGWTADWAAGQVLHPYLGFVTDPNFNKTIDFLGIPSHRFTKKQKGKVIIGISGGSVAENLVLEGNKTLVDTLKSYPTFSEKEIEFVALSLSGFKQPQQLMALVYFLTIGGEFDIIINLDGFNEVALPHQDNRPNNVALVYPRLWNLYSKAVLNSETLGVIAQIDELRKQQGKVKDTLTVKLGKSDFAKLVWILYDRRATGKLNKLYEKLQISLKNKGEDFQSTGPVYNFQTDEDYWNYLANIWAESSIQMARVSKENHIQYFHFLQPNQYLKNSKVLTNQELINAYVSTPTDTNGIYLVYKEAVEKGYPQLINQTPKLKAAGVNFTDLTQIFKQDKEDIYMDLCCHYNPRGTDIIAKAIAKYIGEDFSSH